MFFILNKVFGGFVSFVFIQKYRLRCYCWNEKVVQPAGFRQLEYGDNRIPCFLHLSCFLRDCIDFRICVMPEIIYFLWPFIGEPGCIGNGDIPTLLQETMPVIHAFFKTDIVYCPFTPDQIQFILLLRCFPVPDAPCWKSIHRSVKHQSHGWYALFRSFFILPENCWGQFKHMWRHYTM